MADTGAPKLAANGAHIPALGLGTFRLRGDACVSAVGAALNLGYRHIDTAQMYENERDVGRAIRESGVARDDIFLTTKVWHENIRAGVLQDAARSSLDRLSLDAVDLLLIHWPNASVPLSESIAALCDAKRQGLARNIGVANFPVAMLDEAVALAAKEGEKLATNQVEYHPRLNQDAVLAACRRHGMLLVAYCPVGQGNILDDPTIVAMARQHGRTPAQIVLRWHMQQEGVAAIPKSSSRGHLAENLAVFDFTLSAEDMAALSNLARPNGRLVNPSFAPRWD